MLEALLEKLSSAPETVTFDEVIALVDSAYTFTETAFTNGSIYNKAGENNGSCKILAFGKMHKLGEEQTLHCFGDYYRVDVLGNPEGSSHQNIRNFMQHGWAGINFEGKPL